MNIHFSDKELKAKLDTATIIKVKTGSHVYGLNNENSDIDYLSIYAPYFGSSISFLWEHHQLQYKEDNVDYNYTTLHTFIRNCINGDATINFELLFNRSFKGTYLDWLDKRRYSFINYNIIKSYLGLAKRDLKFVRKGLSYDSVISPTHKRLSHYVRGVIIAMMCLKGEVTMDFKGHRSFKEVECDDFTLLTQLKNGTFASTVELTQFIDVIETYMNNSRDTINTMLNNKTINKFMDVAEMKAMDMDLRTYCLDDHYSEKEMSDADTSDLYYNTLESGIQYN